LSLAFAARLDVIVGAGSGAGDSERYHKVKLVAVTMDDGDSAVEIIFLLAIIDSTVLKRFLTVYFA
jgi:hypothetical protein